MNILVFIKDQKLRATIEEGLHGRAGIKYADDLTEVIIETTENADTIVIAEFDCEINNGYDLVSQIMASSTDEFPFVLLLTDPDNRNAAVDCIGPIPGDYLLKPVDLLEFSARLTLAEKALSLQRRIRDNRQFDVPVSIYDPITGLLNKEAIYQRSLEEANRVSREGSTAAIVVVSIENGDELEESYGKGIYEQALRLVARSLKSNVRLYDLVGRWIGSKFLVMLLGATLDNGVKALERVYQSVSTVVVKLPDNQRAQINLKVAITRTAQDPEKPLYVLIENLNEMINSEEDDHWMAVI